MVQEGNMEYQKQGNATEKYNSLSIVIEQTILKFNRPFVFS